MASYDLIIPGRIQTRQMLLEFLSAYIGSMPDASRWYDAFESGIGQTSMNILASIFEVLMFKVETRSKEAYTLTARTKSAIYLLAQMIGYNPNRKHHAFGTVKGIIRPYATADFTLLKGTELEGAYPLTVNKTYYIPAKTTEVTGIDVIQGQWVTREYSRMLGNLEGRDYEYIYVDEPNYQIDQFELYVKVDGIAINVVDKIEPIDSNSCIARTDYQGGLIVLFGDGTFGKRLLPNSKVEITYLKTLGAGASIDKAIDLGTFPISNQTISFIVETQITGGADEDSVDKVRYLASRFFQAQGRAVTKYDYESVTLSYPGIISAKCNRISNGSDDKRAEYYKPWQPGTNYKVKDCRSIDFQNWQCAYEHKSGDAFDPDKWIEKPSCCTICISPLKQNGNPWTTAEKELLLEYLDDYRMVSNRIEIWEPEAVELNLKIRVVMAYDANHSSIFTYQQEITTLVYEKIQAYCLQLGETWRTTKMVDILTDCHPAIIRVYFDEVNGSQTYPDIMTPCYGFFTIGSITLNWETQK